MVVSCQLAKALKVSFQGRRLDNRHLLAVDIVPEHQESSREHLEALGPRVEVRWARHVLRT
eukprot:4477982-Amphidinium_carterae.1